MAAASGGSWPGRVPGLVYGGDYNPDQWPEQVWAEDVALMREAGVTMVSVAIFSWARLEPEPGRHDFGWLDRVMDLLHEGGVAVDLATATASPPPWFSRLHPDSLPVRADGTRLWPGARQAWCPSSPDYRAAAADLARRMAERYADHPALVMWHVGNEYGCHNAHCFCDTSAASFRRWLQARYGDLDRLNDAWGTGFWSQRYADWAEVLPPRSAPTFLNPTQQLDYWRFSSDELLDCYRAERDVLREVTPDVPVTTNFMGTFKPVDSWAWAPELDVVSNDHYLPAEDRANQLDLALSADLTRSLAGGRPWLLMEHSTSAVNWQWRNVAKQPGQLRRNSLSHLARGADGICFFQWRASQSGAEKFHSAMVPHAGRGTKVWREVVQLGTDLQRLAEVRGSVVRPQAALVLDWSSWWAAELDAHPTQDLQVLAQLRSQYAALHAAGVTVDLVHPAADLSAYRLLVVPNLYLVDDAAAANLRGFVHGGGHLVLSFFSGIVDADDHVRLGGYPGAFRDLVGGLVEEFFPLRAGQTARLSGGGTGSVWSELLHPQGAEVVQTFLDGEVPGAPAVTRHRVGEGVCTYLATVLDAGTLAAVLGGAAAAAGVVPVVDVGGIEAVRRDGASCSYLFLLNHGEAGVAVDEAGVDLLTGQAHAARTTVPAGGVVVLRQDRG